MLSLRRPSTEIIARFLADQATRDFSYAEVGFTARPAPAGYVVDHSRIALGQGRAIFEAAKKALAGWHQFKLGWVEPCPDDVPIEVGRTVGILAHLGPVWWLNACRIVNCVDEAAEVRRYGFAYGTLPDHAEQGEERFLIEWDPRDDQVWFDILAYSQPRHLLARLGYPVVRRLQKRFGREATANFKQATLREVGRANA